MTNEKRYELICNMLRSFDSASGGTMNAAEEVIREPNKWQNSPYFPFYADAAKLLVEARQEMDRKTTRAGSLAALNRIYKSALDNHRENLHGFFPNGDRWALCDGYRFVRVNSKPESIPEAPQKGDPLDLSRSIPAGAEDAEIVTLPTVAEIKAAIADLRSRYGRDWKRNPIEALPGWWCNAQYLLDMVQALPGGIAYKPEKYCTPLYYKSADGDALLLPVRHSAA